MTRRGRVVHCWLLLDARGEIKARFQGEQEANASALKREGDEVLACEEYFAREERNAKK